MQKWILEGLMIGMASVFVGGSISLLVSENSRITLVGSGIGAVASSVIVTKRHRQTLLKRELQLKVAQTELLTSQSEVSNSQGYVLSLENQLKSTQSELSILQAKTANFQANILTLESQLKSAQVEIIVTQTEASNAQAEVSSLLEQLEPELIEVKVNTEPFKNLYSEATFIIDDPSDQIEVENFSKESDAVKNWFANKKITIDNQHQPTSQDVIFNKHAIFLGEHLRDENHEPLLAPLLKQIRWAISQNRGIQYHFKKANQNQTRILTQFCRHLFDDTLFSSYRYVKNNDQKIIHAAIQDRADIRVFFDGIWFERFICHKVYSVLDELNISYSYVMNPIIKFANGDRFELDLFFLINGQPLLIECKTGGNFTAHIKRFADHCKRLSLSPSNAYLVTLDLEDAQSENLSQLWKFTVVNQDGLVDRLQKTYKNV
jgi:hypothetical protein